MVAAKLTATETAMATTTTIKQQSTNRSSKRNGGDGDGDGNSEGDNRRRWGRWRRHGNRGNGNGHGIDGCRFFWHFAVRKTNRQIKKLFRCTCTEYYLLFCSTKIRGFWPNFVFHKDSWFFLSIVFYLELY